MRTFFLLINGIRAPLGAEAWQDRAAAWIHTHTDDYAEAYEYSTWALTRRLTQGKHIRAVADMIRLHCYAKPSDRIVVVAHSNGCEIALKAVSQYPSLPVAELHLFASAADRDCGKNGLNKWLYASPERRAYLYCSAADKALLAATWSQRLMGWMGLGYGDMGRKGPSNICPRVERQAISVWREGYGHSDWFIPANMDETMSMVTHTTARAA